VDFGGAAFSVEIVIDLSTRPASSSIVMRVLSILQVFPILPISASNRSIWSWFERHNIETGEVTHEYIEPLVSHLRHPLARCGAFGEFHLMDRTYILPGVAGTNKTFLFDAGSSSWDAGSGGPSLTYFARVWQLYGFDWHHIEAWEGKTPSTEFYSTVPSEWKSRVKYHHEWISTTPLQQPFVPSVIHHTTSSEDYVVFKLDIDSNSVETAIVEYMLKWEHLDLIDEFLWEHHVNNYLMAPNWRESQDMSKTIADSYEYFLALRHRGVRAHS